MAIEIQELCGPIYAESLENDDDYIESYIKSSKDINIRSDKYISSIINGNRVVLSGVRGSGKTMILKVVSAVLKKDVKKSLILGNRNMIIPVFISYSGFKEDVSLQEEFAMSPLEMTTTKEIFRSYFFMSILQEILSVIEELELDENIEFNFFGLRTKFGIKREIDKAIREFKRKGFREILTSKEKGMDIGVKVPVLNFVGKGGATGQTKEVLLNDMQKVSLFKETIESLCETYGISKIMFLYDEVHYLKYLQSEFFNTLFSFRNFKYIGYAISAYPTFMNYGDSFDVPDDAKELMVSNILYKPTKDEYERPLIELVSTRLKKYSGIDQEEVIENDALKFLILLFNGNPRMLLQAIQHLWVSNNQKTIQMSTINQNVIEEMESSWYTAFCNNQAKRFRTNIDKVNKFIKIVISRITEYNQRNEMATIYFMLNEDIQNKYSETIDLLLYCRMIDKIRVSSFGGSKGSKGKVYLVTPIILWSYGAFNKKQISGLDSCVMRSIAKDIKIQFDSITKIDSLMGESKGISCHRLDDARCTNPMCTEDTYSEMWKICPFNGLDLSIKVISSSEISIDKLEVISEKIKTRLHAAGIDSLHDVLIGGEDELMKIQYIKRVRAKNIYFASKEYVDDNL